MKKENRIRAKNSSVAVAKQSKTRLRYAFNPAEFKLVRLRECPINNPITDSPEAINSFWRDHIPSALWFESERECFCILLLNTRRRLIGFHMVGIGTLDTVATPVRETFRAAIQAGASAIVLTHNHPSGDPQPSEGDVRITRVMSECGKLLKIDVLDHLVIGGLANPKSYCSFHELGLIKDEIIPKNTAEECLDPKESTHAHLDLESVVQETKAVLHLCSEPLISHYSSIGKRMDSVAAGIANLVAATEDKLTQAFDNAWDEWRLVKGSPKKN